MIEYKFPEEKEFILHYAKKLNQPLIEKIINAGQVSSSQEANALSKFFWEMVDALWKIKNHPLWWSAKLIWKHGMNMYLKAYVLICGIMGMHRNGMIMYSSPPNKPVYLITL